MKFTRINFMTHEFLYKPTFMTHEFLQVYFHDPLASPENHQNEFHAHELQSNSISWANNSFVLGEQN